MPTRNNLSIRFPIYIFALLFNATLYAATGSNGADYAAIYSLSRHIEDPLDLSEKVSGLEMNFLPDARELEHVFKENGVNAILFEGNAAEAIQQADDDSLIIFE